MTLRADRLFGGRPVSIAEYERPMLSDEVETAQTVHMMDRLADADAGHRLVVDAAHEALRDAGLQIDSPRLLKTCAVFWWLKKHIRYVPTPGTSPLVDQTLIPPVTLLSMPDPEGDCPQFSMLASAMLRVLCVPSYYKTIAGDPDYPDTYSHIYNIVQIGPRQFMPFDSSNGPEPGAEYAQPFKVRVWPQLANDPCKETMLRNETPRRNRNVSLHRSMGRMGALYQTLNGLGRLGDTVCDQDGNCYDTTDPTNVTQTTSGGEPVFTSPTGASSSTIMQGPNPTAGELANAGYPLTTIVQTAAPSSAGGVSNTTLALALAQDATQIVTPIVRAATQQQPYYVTNPATGQSVLYDPNTGTLAGGSLGAALSSISPTVLLAIAAIGLLFIIPKK